jgi:hypothetical protein
LWLTDSALAQQSSQAVTMADGQYKVHFNEAHPHQGIGQRVSSGIHHHDVTKPIVITPVLGGLHADYRRAA